MLVLVPYEVAVKKAQKKATGTRKGLRRKVISDSSSENTEAHSSHKDEEEKRKVLPPVGGGGDRKRKAAPSGEAEGSKKGRTLLPDCSTTAAFSDKEWLPRDKPLAKS